MSSKRVLVINQSDLYNKYPEIGRGDEGTVYNYEDQYAIKVFTRYKREEYLPKLKRKIEKVKALSELQDPSCAFPLGLVSTDGKTLDGYYTQLVKSKKNINNFTNIRKLKDLRKILKCLQQGDATLRRIHEMGITLGDIKGNNILINRAEEPVYIDLDNCLYEKFFFDLIPDRAGILYSLFSGPISYKDNDKLLYAIMAMHILTQDVAFIYYKDGREMKAAIRKLDVDRETKETLQCIFSDATNKPYIGDVLTKIKK